MTRKRPRLMTPKKLAFVGHVVAGKNSSDAYCLSYNAGNMGRHTIWNKACDLMKQPEVKEMIEERRAAVVAAVTASQAWDLDKLVRESETNMELGRALEQIAASNGAINTIGKATGLLIDRQESKHEINVNWRFTIGKGYDEDKVIEGESEVVE